MEGELAAAGVISGGSFAGGGARATLVITAAVSFRYVFAAIAGCRWALIQIVDAALADATRRSGEWLVCRPGCTQCCVGVFAINRLDTVRLQQGLADLEKTDPQ